MTSSSRFLAAVDLGQPHWTKSSYSGNDASQCVEVADVSATRKAIAIRDSKNPHGPVLMFDPASFRDFITDVAGGRFDI